MGVGVSNREEGMFPEVDSRGVSDVTSSASFFFLCRKAARRRIWRRKYDGDLLVFFVAFGLLSSLDSEKLSLDPSLKEREN